mmetsp:Transcript_122961/g.213340  ORF Transcript_122961/g.213340 Transcript_122961/m.213340 type:complete len:222 (+) Transcript_122961:3-668(+)
MTHNTSYKENHLCSQSPKPSFAPEFSESNNPPSEVSLVKTSVPVTSNFTGASDLVACALEPLISRVSAGSSGNQSSPILPADVFLESRRLSSEPSTTLRPQRGQKLRPGTRVFLQTHNNAVGGSIPQCLHTRCSSGKTFPQTQRLARFFPQPQQYSMPATNTSPQLQLCSLSCIMCLFILVRRASSFSLAAVLFSAIFETIDGGRTLVASTSSSCAVSCED